MAGNDDGDRRAADRAADGADAVGAAEAPRQLGVAHGRAVRDPPELRPDGALEVRAVQLHIELEDGALPGEVLLELLDRSRERRIVAVALVQRRAPTREAQRTESGVAGDQGQRADRAVEDGPHGFSRGVVEDDAERGPGTVRDGADAVAQADPVPATRAGGGA